MKFNQYDASQKLNSDNPLKKRIKNKKSLIVILENITDARTVNEIFRACDAVRVEKVYVCGETSVPHKDTLFNILWQYSASAVDVARNLRCKEYQVSVAQMTNRSQLYYETSYDRKQAIVFGGEEGISDAVLSIADQFVHLPLLGQQESLPEAMTAGIILSNIHHQLDLEQREKYESESKIADTGQDLSYALTA